MTLALTPEAWTQIIVAFSIFGPVVVALVIAIVVLRGAKDDPDEQRLRRAHEDYKASRED